MPQVIPIIVGIVQGVAAVVTAVSAAIAVLGPIGGALFKLGVGLVISKLLAPSAPRGALARRNSTFAIRQPSPSRRIPYGVTRLGGIYFYAETTAPAGSDDLTLLNLVLGIGDGPIEAVDKMYFGAEEVTLVSAGTDSNGRPVYGATSGTTWHPTGGVALVLCSFYTGSAGQPADATLVAASASKWTTSHTLDGISYARVTLAYDHEVFKLGVPNISFEIRGRNDIYDPRTASSSYSANTALCLNHYLTSTKTGPNVSYADEIDASALTAAANICDESVSLDAGGTESRYTCNGYVDLAEKPESVIGDFKTAMAGWMVYSGGRFKIYAGAFETPTFTVDADMLGGGVTIKNRTPKRERFNLVKGVYQSPQTVYQPTDFPSVTNATYQTEDGEEIDLDIELVFTTSPATAQRIAKIELERSRLELVVSLICNLRALPAEAGMTVYVTLSRYDWDAKAFFVQSSTLGLLEDGTVGVSLSLREIASSVYSWTPGTDEKAVAAAPSLAVGAPQVDTLEASPDGASDFGDEDFPLRVGLSTDTADASIRWSKTSTPTSNSGNPYDDAPDERPLLSEGETLYARGFKEGYLMSDALEETYTSTNSANTVSGLHGRFRSDLEPSLNLWSTGGLGLWTNVGQQYNAGSGTGGADITNSGSFTYSPLFNPAKLGVEFDGSNDRLWTRDGTRGGVTYVFGYRMPPVPCTVVIALTNSSDVNSGTLFSSVPEASGDSVGIFRYYGYWLAWMKDGAYKYQSGGTPATASTFEVVAATFSDSSRGVRVNKSSDAPNTTALTVDIEGPIGLGADVQSTTDTSLASDFWPGTVNEVMIFDSVLSDSDIDDLTDYLGGKYNPS
jgi:hypothetical protein